MNGNINIQPLGLFTATQGGKLAVFPLSPELLISFLSNPKPQTLQVTKNCLPEDVRIVESTWGIAGLALAVVLHSEAFEMVPPGGNIPVLPAVEMKACRIAA